MDEEGEDISEKLVGDSSGNEDDAYAKLVALHNAGILEAMEREVEARKSRRKRDLIARTR